MNAAYLPIPTDPTHGIEPDSSDSSWSRPLSQHEKLIHQTRKWVAMSFFEPMLEEMRNSPFRSDLFDGG